MGIRAKKVTNIITRAVLAVIIIIGFLISGAQLTLNNGGLKVDISPQKAYAATIDVSVGASTNDTYERENSGAITNNFAIEIEASPNNYGRY